MGFSYRGDGVLGVPRRSSTEVCCMGGPRPPPTSPSTVAERQETGPRSGQCGLRAAAAELAHAGPTVRDARDASGRRLQGANGPAEASGTRLNGEDGVAAWREIARGV